MKRSVLILGASGAFGRVLARDLARRDDVWIKLAGRDLGRLEDLAAEIDRPWVVPTRLDLGDLDAYEGDVARAALVVCAAGPYQRLDPELPRLAARYGAHWLDISDHAAWTLRLLDDDLLDHLAKKSGAAVLSGLGGVPAVSGMLARWLGKRFPEARHLRTSLLLGERAPKGAGTIEHLLSVEPRDGARVAFPGGVRRAWRLPSADENLNRREGGLPSEFRVAFEAPWLQSALWALRPSAKRVGVRPRAALARTLAVAAAPLARLGRVRTILQVEVFGGEEQPLATARFAARGTGLTALPAALAAHALLSGELKARGCLNPSTWLEPGDWIARLQKAGVEFQLELA